jgi:hypothetical protein
MPKSPKEMIEALTRNLPAKTGRTFDQWVTLAKKKGPKDRKALTGWLKTEHGLGTVTAHFISGDAVGQGVADAYADEGKLIDAMYSGDRAPLRPVYDKLAEAAQLAGKDVVLTVCKTYVGLRRARQFGMIKPATRGRVFLGLALPGIQPEGRLVPAGSIGNDRMTHRIEITGLKEVDGEVKRWLKTAYGRAT